MLRALFEMVICTDPKSSRHGNGCAWYVFIFGSALRGASGPYCTVVHGPHGSSATSTASASPQYPSTAVVATHWPSR